jgi:hypothetical protein
MTCSKNHTEPVANKAHALDGGIPSVFHIGRRWPAASDDVQR